MQHAMRTCPYCAEEIKATALKCRFCGSFVYSAARDRFREAADRVENSWRAGPGSGGTDPAGSKNGLLLGVCARIAEATALPPILVRALFVVGGVILRGNALLIYAALWAFMPGRDGGPSFVNRALVKARSVAEGIGALFRPAEGSPPAGPSASRPGNGHGHHPVNVN